MLNLEVFLAMGHLIIKNLQENRAWKMFVDNMFLKITLFQNLLIFFANLRFFVFSKLSFNIFLKHYRDKSKKHLFSNETSTLSCKRYTPVTGNHNGSATSDNSGIKPKNDSIFIKLRTFQGTIINSDRNILRIILLFPYLLKSHVKICIV